MKQGIYILIILILFLIANLKKEYIISLFLEGHIILKLMQKYSLIENEIFSFAIYFGLVGVVLIFKQKIKIYNALKLYSIYFLFLLYIYLSIQYSLDKLYGQEKFISFFIVSFPILFFSDIIIKNKIDYINMLESLVNLAIITGLITIICIYIDTGKFTARLGTTEAQKIQFLGTSLSVSIWFGRRMVLGIIASIVLLFVNPSKKKYLKMVLLCIFSLLSISRGPILSLIVILILICIQERKKIKSNLIVIIPIIFLLIILLIYFYKDIEIIFFRIFNYSDKNVSSRIEALIIGLKSFISTPVMGIGLGGYKFLNPILKYPHNIILEIMVELGLIGLSFIGILFSVLSINFYKVYINKKIKAKKIFLFPIYIFIFSIINGLVSGNLVSNEYIFFSMVLLFISKEILKKERYF